MKLLLCFECHDLVSLSPQPTGTWRACYCTKSTGRYLSDNAHAEYTGPAAIVGLGNEVMMAMESLLKTGVMLGLIPALWEWQHRAVKVERTEGR